MDLDATTPSRAAAPGPPPASPLTCRPRSQHGAARASVRAKDPASMAPEARLAELGALLARGFRRIGLDELGKMERPCDRTVDAPENPETEDA